MTCLHHPDSALCCVCLPSLLEKASSTPGSPPALFVCSPPPRSQLPTLPCTRAQVQGRMQTLKEKLFHHVGAVLEAGEDHPASALVGTGRWKAVWEKAKSFLGRGGHAGPAGDAHAAGDLQATLAELHQDIQAQISAEVRCSGASRLAAWDAASKPWLLSPDWIACLVFEQACQKAFNSTARMSITGKSSGAVRIRPHRAQSERRVDRAGGLVPACSSLCSHVQASDPRGWGLQVSDFWHEIELALNVRQHSMFQAVNAHLERLSRGVDDVVGGLLHLRLEPVVVRMEPPTAAQFHSSLQELFEKGECPHDARLHRQHGLVGRTGFCRGLGAAYPLLEASSRWARARV